MTETARPRRKQKKEDKPWSKNYVANQGPLIRGSRLVFTTSSTRGFQEPLAVPMPEKRKETAP